MLGPSNGVGVDIDVSVSDGNTVAVAVAVAVGVVFNTGYHQEMAVLGSSDQENRRPRLKMFKLKCLNKVASFSIFK